MRSFVLKPEAELDFQDAYDWYEFQRPGLGEEFARSVPACLALVCRHPQIFPTAVDEFRRALVRRFPYELIYEITPARNCRVRRLQLLPQSRTMAATPPINPPSSP